FFTFNKMIIDEIYDLIPAVKPQIAMYEKYGLEGLRAYFETTQYCKSKGLIIIGDVKRGDIASTAAAYAGHIAGVDIEGEYFDLWNEDAITVNPYLGYDGIEPFLGACKQFDKGLFILVKTSNPSSCEIQDLKLDNKHIYNYVADLVSKWGENLIGEYGYSNIGAVVGATYREQGEELRSLMPHTFFLVPGYGAQGGKASDLKGYFDKDGRGAIINSSRGIISAYKTKNIQEKDFAKVAREAVIEMKNDLKG
ncbi:MAG: orotidine 5'-phosphate decarboxylase, partial [Epulopiscium sp. Nele67-Bin001]